MINIKNLSFSYNGLTPYQLNNINVGIPKEEFISIIGENGSGKTTLLKLLLGFLKPTKGLIDCGLYKIGYVPQKIDSFNSQFSITVYEILKVHLKAFKIKNATEIDRVLKIVNMEKHKNKLIGSLSGGQQQRIFIARALMGNPDLLVLDEPSTGVDEKTQDEIYSLLHHLNKEHKVTILCVEHNLKKALKYSSYLLEIKSGKGNLYENKLYLNKISSENLKRKVN